MNSRVTFCKLLFFTMLLSSGALLGACGNKNGGHGESCEARNDCQRGFACVGQRCVKDDFPISIESGKDCVLIDCDTTADCCGDRPTSPPARCADRDRYCEPLLQDCSADMYCTADEQCGEGTCSGVSYCSNSGQVCASDLNCVDTCNELAGTCNISGALCTTSDDCNDGTCELSSGNCNCSNPEYDPSHALCSDSQCTDICDLVCNASQRCVVETLCESDADCAGSFHCNSAGSCVQCLEDSHCGDDESCRFGSCDLPCSENEHCGIFEECQSGDCVYVGCQSDRECVLWANVDFSRDAREARCVEVDGLGTKQCRIPCESDRECGATERCDSGVCTYIGCETDQECRAFYNRGNQSKTSPYISEAFCVELEE